MGPVRPSSTCPAPGVPTSAAGSAFAVNPFFHRARLPRQQRFVWAAWRSSAPVRDVSMTVRPGSRRSSCRNWRRRQFSGQKKRRTRKYCRLMDGLACRRTRAPPHKTFPPVGFYATSKTYSTTVPYFSAPLSSTSSVFRLGMMHSVWRIMVFEQSRHRSQTAHFLSGIYNRFARTREFRVGVQSLVP